MSTLFVIQGEKKSSTRP